MTINPAFVEGPDGLHPPGAGAVRLPQRDPRAVGRLDSAVAALAVQAVGPSRVLALIMPYGNAYPRDVRDASALRLGVRTESIDIAPAVDAYFSRLPHEEPRPEGQQDGPGTDVASLRFFGAGQGADHRNQQQDRAPDRIRHHPRRHGLRLRPARRPVQNPGPRARPPPGLPAAILRKAPTAGLWPGQTDEAEIGLSYAELDRVLYRLVDLRESRREVVAGGFDRRKVERIAAMIRRSEFKRRMPPIAKLSFRTVSHDFSIPMTGAAEPWTPADPSPRPAGRSTSSRRRSGTSRISGCGRFGSRREVDLIACEDTRQTVSILNRHGIDAKLAGSYQARERCIKRPPSSKRWKMAETWRWSATRARR